jgi:hypothetical protein
MRKADLNSQFRLVYCPQPDRVPRWMRHLWAWF